VYYQLTEKLRDQGFYVENDLETAKAIINECQMEYIIDKTKSPWCKLVDNNVLKQFEFYEDITYHCKFGYKYTITKLMTCDLLKDLVDRLKDMKDR
jgi:hypothetical protein